MSDATAPTKVVDEIEAKVREEFETSESFRRAISTIFLAGMMEGIDRVEKVMSNSRLSIANEEKTQ